MSKLLLVLALIGGGFYYYNNYMQPGGGLTVKNLLDKVASAPVSSDEAHTAFKNAVVDFCKTNGTNPGNGYGTTEQCLSQLESQTDARCTSLAMGGSLKQYSSQPELKSAFRTYFKCAARALERQG